MVVASERVGGNRHDDATCSDQVIEDLITLRLLAHR